jgi:patatin-like phospholipase/acyl hydrolase
MPDKELCLLALDGGGVRGLSTLMILEELMEKINPDSPPKPCDYFDMIGGTRTGGWVIVPRRQGMHADQPGSSQSCSAG